MPWNTAPARRVPFMAGAALGAATPAWAQWVTTFTTPGAVSYPVRANVTQVLVELAGGGGGGYDVNVGGTGAWAAPSARG